MPSFTDFSDGMKILGIIPARYDSSRFPGKPLVVIDGKTMIRRVYEQALACPLLDRVIIATDDPVIESHVMQFGGNVVMTAKHHRSGTERCAEVATRPENGEFSVVINIQGDEPFIDPRQITQVCEAFSEKSVKIATLVRKITEKSDPGDSNVVKVVFDSSFRALYFSRSAIPHYRGVEPDAWISHTEYYRHVGIYGYTTETLLEIVHLPPSPLEDAERLEQLRWLGHGIPIHVKETAFDSFAIDTPADLLKITNRS
jgi:3-deoxy-manno-octulosonate cytidylyltransferase (CMP-KDO synthetase)